MKSYIKTESGYFTVYGWDFRWDVLKIMALPFPNQFKISLNTAKAILKNRGITKFEVIRED